MAIWSRKPSRRPSAEEPPTRIRSAPLAQDVPSAAAQPQPAPKVTEVTDDGEPETLDMAETGAPEAAASPIVTAEPATTIAAKSETHNGAAPDDAMEDPPAGFLVIVEGPGKGRFVAYGYGANTIGRAANQRVQLDFGDAKISRENHAQIVFDPKTKKISIRHETGANLTYLDGEAVLTPQEIAPRAIFQVGDTHLMVIPLCDGLFDWEI